MIDQVEASLNEHLTRMEHAEEAAAATERERSFYRRQLGVDVTRLALFIEDDLSNNDGYVGASSMLAALFLNPVDAQAVRDIHDYVSSIIRRAAEDAIPELTYEDLKDMRMEANRGE